MLILGIGDFADCGSALVRDGRVIAAVNDERLVRTRKVLGIPRTSIREVMRVAGVEPGEIDAVAVGTIDRQLFAEYTEFLGGWFGMNGMRAEQRIRPDEAGRTGARRSPILRAGVRNLLDSPVHRQRRSALKRVLRSELGIRARVKFVDHHYCHANAAYFTSDFGPDATVITIDHGCQESSAKVFEVLEGRLTELARVPSFHSLAAFYSCITQICGHQPGLGEGRVAALAVHGEPVHRNLLDSQIHLYEGQFINSGREPFDRAVEHIRRLLPAGWTRRDLAASLQAHTEHLVCEFVRYWVARTHFPDLALSGSLFANPRLVQRIRELPEVAGCFVYPGISDAGVGVGAALALRYDRVPRPAADTRALDHMYLGPAFTAGDVAGALEEAHLASEPATSTTTEVATLLSRGAVVGVLDGPMEFGPRSLGSRTILYQPDDPTVLEWLNQKLGRPEGTPFAPVVMEEHAEQCFVGIEGAERSARFASMIFECTDWMKEHCPGVVHVDGTARPQIVRAEDAPGLHAILKEYHSVTGLPVLLSAGLGLQGEPVACTPADAIAAFRAAKLDYLAMGGRVVGRAGSFATAHGGGSGR